jgi:hypothetical protein
MWRVPSLALLPLLLAAADTAQAQQAHQAQPVAESASGAAVSVSEAAAAPAAVFPSPVRSANGAAYFIEMRSAQAVVRKASTRHAATPPSRLVLEALAANQLGVLEKLNRVDAQRLRRLNTLVVPAAWADDELAYSPFPQDYPWATSKAQTIVVDQAAQAFGAYEYDGSSAGARSVPARAARRRRVCSNSVGARAGTPVQRIRRGTSSGTSTSSRHAASRFTNTRCPAAPAVMGACACSSATRSGSTSGARRDGKALRERR